MHENAVSKITSLNLILIVLYIYSYRPTGFPSNCHKVWPVKPFAIITYMIIRMKHVIAVILLLVGSLFDRPSLTFSQLIQFKRMDFHCLLGRNEAEAHAGEAAVARVAAEAVRRPAIPRIAGPATTAAHAERPR